MVMKKKREANDTRQIYFDHQLTPYTRAQFMEARKTAKIIGAKSAFVGNGQIFIAKDDTTKLKISTFEDCLKLKHKV